MWVVLTPTNVDYTLSAFCRCWDPYSVATALHKRTILQSRPFHFYYNNIASCRHPMDKRNASGSAEDITETRNDGNSSHNLEVRILRSRAAKKPPGNSKDTLVKPTPKRIRRKRPTKSGPNDDELSKIRKQITYFCNRISYRQTFCEAYENEGWKNQRFTTSLFMYLFCFVSAFSWIV